MVASGAALALALAAAAAPASPPDLDWLAGYWLSCADGTEVAETWGRRRAVHMLGTSVTLGVDGASTFEQMRIFYSFSSGEAWQVRFIAQPAGAAATEFLLVRHGPGEAVFENPAHDFPQRIRYRRDGDLLTGRIEGAGGRAMEWRYQAAPLGTRCP